MRAVPARPPAHATVTAQASAIGWRGLCVALLGLTDSGLLWWGSGASTAHQLVAVLAGAAMGWAAVLWVGLDRGFSRAPLWWVMGLALVLRLVAMQAVPLLEDDHYRYLWDGLRTATSFDPYRLPPSAYFGANDLTAPWQDILSGINNPDVPTIYGPVLQWLFALAHLIAPGRVGAIQAGLLLVDMACLGLLVRQRVGTRWLLAYALHPMILKEAMASAHPDGLVALLLLLAMAAWQRGFALRVGALLGLAVATKVAALVVLPLFLFSLRRNPALDAPTGSCLHADWRGALRVSIGFAASLCLTYLPFIAAGGSDGAALQTFATLWRFNPLLFRVLEAGLPANTARAAAAGLLLACIAGLWWRWQQRARLREPGLPPVDLAMLLLLLLAPVVNPWYWLWALAPAMLAGRCLVAAVAAAGVLSYLNSSVLREAGWLAIDGAAAPFSVSGPIAMAQLAALSLAWILQRRFRTAARL